MLDDRFWSKVNKTRDCWLWTAASWRGYGAFKIDGKSYGVHRLVYEEKIGQIPDDMSVCHSCYNTLCVNPDHLMLMSTKEYMLDAAARGKTYVKPRVYNHGTSTYYRLGCRCDDCRVAHNYHNRKWKRNKKFAESNFILIM